MKKLGTLVFMGLVLATFPLHAATGKPGFPFKLALRPSLNEVQRFKGAGKDHLVYELFLENFEHKPIHLEALQIQVQRAGKDVFVKELRGEELAKSFTIVSENYLKSQDPMLSPASGGILFVFLDLPDKVGAADTIINQVVVQAPGETLTRMTLEAGKVAISAKPVRVVSPPLQGQGWFSPNAPANDSIHRRIVIPIDAHVWAPERFAIDWIRLNEKGTNYSGPREQNTSYHAYGAPILSVAPGKVIEVKDSIPENVPNSSQMAVPINMETIGGNHVLVDIGGGLYAFYAHLQPGKISVKLGDILKTGDSIGLLGNSGNSTEPHLHFHIIDQPDPLRGQGQPYVYDHFTHVLGEVQMNKEEDPVGVKVHGREELRNQANMNLELVDFP